MWIETSREVYAVLHARHGKDFCVHSSFTDSTGTGYEYSSGHPHILTEYGFKDSDYPLLKLQMDKEHESDKEWDYKYFIAVNQKEND